MPLISSFTYNAGAGSIGNAIDNASDGNVFPNISLEEARAGFTKHKCVYITSDKNYTDLGIYIASATPSPDTKIYVGLGVAGINADEDELEDESVPPTGVLFVHPINIGYPLELPNLDAGDRLPIWLKLVVDENASGAKSDYCRIYIDGIER